MIKLKAWESMTNAERAAQTFRDKKLIEKRKLEAKRRAEYDAKCFTFESIMKSVARAKSAKNRGCRSCR